MKAISIATVALVALWAVPALADTKDCTITIDNAEPGTTASISASVPGSNPWSTGETVPANGTLTLTIPGYVQDGTDQITKKWIPKGQYPATNTKVVSMPEGTVSASEPFQVPDLVDLLSTGITINVDLVSYLSQPPLTLGEQLAVADGVVAGTSALTLPGYTGTAQVTAFDQYAPIPEPSATGLVLIAGLAACRRRPSR